MKPGDLVREKLHDTDEAYQVLRIKSNERGTWVLLSSDPDDCNATSWPENMQEVWVNTNSLETVSK